MQIQTYSNQACTIPAIPIDFPDVNVTVSGGTINPYTIGDFTFYTIRGAVELTGISTADKKLFCQYTSNTTETLYIKPETGISFVRLTIKCGLRSVIDPTFTPANMYRYQLYCEVFGTTLVPNDWTNVSSGGTSISSDAQYNFFSCRFTSGGHSYLAILYQTTGNSVHGFFVDEKLFNNSIRPDTKSQTPTVTPNGWYGTGTTTPGNMTFSSAPSALSHGNATAHGLRVYGVSDAQMERLYQTLWSDTIWSKWKNQKFNPIAGIIAYHRLPIQISYDTMEAEISICGQKYIMGTPLSAPKVVKDCMPSVLCAHPLYNPSGIMQIPEVAGSFLDYQPYCSAVLHLPFIGNVPIEVNAISGGSISVQYWIDVCSGNCLAHVLTTDRNGSSIVYGEYSGNCAYKYPVTGNDGGGFAILGAAAGVATAGIAAAATGGAAAPFAASVISGGASALSAEHHTQQVGTWPANASAMCDTNVYLVITRPAYLTPDHYPDIKGRPAGTGSLIKDYKGLVAGEMHADNLSGLTEAEKRTIEQSFRNGVYI